MERRGIYILGIAAAVFFAGCASPNRYYLTGKGSEKEELVQLFALFDKEKAPGERRFVIIQQIANTYLKRKEYGRLINFLTTYVDREKNDQYGGYYLFLVSYAYTLQEAFPIAAIYFDRIVKNYPDLAVKEESIHLACLKQLIGIEKEPERKIDYYRELLAKFPEKIDMGSTLFLLGQAYEKLGEWDLAIQTYSRFMPYVETVIPGFPDAYRYAKKMVDFSNSVKDWTADSLPTLLADIKDGLSAGSAKKLRRYRAKVNFFAMSWEQDENDSNVQTEFDIGAFLDGGRIGYADQVDRASNTREAFLRTWGWSDRIPIWYLYFRKIYFPADPEIHGRWEWAGIYFGERMQ